MDAGKNRTEDRPSAKSDDYLWDGPGEPDPEIQRLESVLGRLRHDPARHAAPERPESASLRDRWRDWLRVTRLAPALAAAALVIVAVMMLRPPRRQEPAANPRNAWDVASLTG